MQLPSQFDNLVVQDQLTPCLLVCPALVEHNLRAMIQIAGQSESLRPHVKTHKCRSIVQVSKSLGITKHKCATLAEAEMLLQEGCDTLVAYPQVGPSATRLVELAQQYPQAACSTIVDSLPAAQHLAAAASSANVKMDVLIDLNTGMDRTGILPNESAVALAKQVAQLELLRLVGLHVYDGQNHQSQRAQRDAAVAELMDSVWKLVQQLHELGLSIGSLVCGGTPTFPVFAEIAKSWRQTHSQIRIELSPGTSVLSDYNYSRDYDDLSAIKPAVVLLTRIVSKPGDGLITVDLGHKAVAADQPAGRRCHFVEIPDAQELKHSEEHLVVRTNLADRLAIGQVLRVLPAHVCPTVALHESMLLVNDHRIDGVWPITRHRLYR